MTLNQPNSQRGFSLIELIASMVILSVAMPVLLWAIHEAQIRRNDPVMVSRARWLATEKLEDIIADRHSTTRGWDYLIGTNYSAETTVPGFTGFGRTVTLAETTADLVTSGSGFMTVTVNVTWEDGRRGARALAVATVLTEYTP